MLSMLFHLWCHLLAFVMTWVFVSIASDSVNGFQVALGLTLWTHPIDVVTCLKFG